MANTVKLNSTVLLHTVPLLSLITKCELWYYTSQQILAIITFSMLPSTVASEVQTKRYSAYFNLPPHFQVSLVR